MRFINRLLERFDSFQKTHPVLSLPLAILKKYSEDKGGQHAGLLTYYGFLSLFPLLLLLVTVLGILMVDNMRLREDVLHSTLSYFPLFSESLGQNIQPLSGAWPQIVFSGIVALLAGFGVVNAFRSTIDDLWHIPRTQRRAAPWSYVENIGLLIVGALILGATTLVASLIVRTGSPLFYALVMLINFGLFLLAYRIATSRTIKTKHLLIQSALTAIAWQGLHALGFVIVRDMLGDLSALYGSFALVLGLLAWLYIVARVAVLAIAIEVVITRKLWPRSLRGQLTPADKTAYRTAAQTHVLDERETIAVTFKK